MNKIIIHFSGNEEGMPAYQSALAAGADLRASVPEDLVIKPGGRALVPTGIHLQIPAGYEGQVRPRSGLALEYGVTMLNSPGTIDADYRGEIRVLLINHGNRDFTVKKGDRIGQIIFSPVIRGEFIFTQELSESERGEGGFGSTGIS
ncbi:MAG: dUTP diphosphatase [Spirochaetales bacterium]|jgi:dUTP pyrophosphatase|nr:dUTP diphosphatase [Spirochaetales bacterium]